ncbi:hypothetical protein GWK47_007628 [Chionoecetes opilio]|uniref:Uncharacterized protein n=1 Tax=Chionoecetes opilio TaxID=41210 RepID=A0A8J4YBW7_CHIOP|nr:hypothetical protein GWK47_007628 [Chionoecetes opilio]
MDRSSPILDDFDEELFIGLEEMGKELYRYKESSKSHESEGGSHPSVVHRQPAFTYLHCLPHPPQDTSRNFPFLGTSMFHHQLWLSSCTDQPGEQAYNFSILQTRSIWCVTLPIFLRNWRHSQHSLIFS